MKKIFMVTVLHLTPLKKNIKYKKTVALFKTFKEADSYVLGDVNNLFEVGKFEVAVVEEVPYGVYNFAHEHWYEAVYSYATQKLEAVLTTPKPEYLRDRRNFAMVDR